MAEEEIETKVLNETRRDLKIKLVEINKDRRSLIWQIFFDIWTTTPQQHVFCKHEALANL